MSLLPLILCSYKINSVENGPFGSFEKKMKKKL